MESEKKSKRTVKRAYSGPVIQYRSTRMPLIEEIEIVSDKTLVFCTQHQYISNKFFSVNPKQKNQCLIIRNIMSALLFLC